MRQRAVAEPMDKQVKKTRLLIADTDPAFIQRISQEMGEFYQVDAASSLSTLEEELYTDNIELLILSEHFPNLNSNALLDKLFSIKKYPRIFVIYLLNEENEEKTSWALDVGYHFVLHRHISPFQLKASLLSLHKLQDLSNKATRLIHQYKGQAEKDPLTKLFNRGVFFDYAHREFSRSRRNHFPLSILMLDIDHFKKINDSYGHLGGDFILIELAELLTQQLRGYDFISRYGGDEFIVTLPHTGLEQAKKVAEKLKNVLEDHSFSFNEHSLHITVSIGLASLSDTPPPQSLKQLISYADEALYLAKQKGRNTICTYMQLLLDS